MLFNSYVFVFLMLPISIIGYFLINKTKYYRLGEAYLLGMSLWFIGYMNYKYVLVIIPSILINYSVARMMNRNNAVHRKFMLGLGVVFDVVILLLFKYYNFFAQSINDKMNLDIPTIYFILPLGISFYTFQQISYLVDCYRDNSIRYGLLEYSTYICFYPQFVQGPIVFQDEFIPQLLDENKKNVNYKNIIRGFYRFVLGLSKKVLLADYLALIVDGGHENISTLNSISAIIVIVAYTLQIYFDFSGYSDMALGIGQMFNLELPENFNSPYKASSIDEHWDRWHITLTRFFTKYVYFPLGGSRKGEIRTLINIFIVFAVSGLWHGAEWSFLVWGVLHGIAKIITRIMRKFSISLKGAIGTVVTFIYVSITLVFFRVNYTNNGILLLKRIFAGGFNGLLTRIYSPLYETVEGALLCRLDVLGLQNLYEGIWAIVFVIVLMLVCFFMKNTKEILAKNIVDGDDNSLCISNSMTLVVIILFLWCIISFSGVAKYIYWNF